MRVQILPTARERLIGIWAYTADQWGEEQADQYVGELIAAMNGLPVKRDVWRPLKERRFKGIYSIRCNHHYVFFKVLENGTLGVLSILHENMDLPNRLTDDVGQ